MSMMGIRAIFGQYSPLLNSSSSLSNGQLRISSLEREEGIPFNGRDWRLGQWEISSSEREEGSADSESDWRLGQFTVCRL
uniref:Putative ovule protein n=1 Tax=Solanum chacoense TaxID=4108 RepID=A0A0V0I0B4_SOLCH